MASEVYEIIATCGPDGADYSALLAAVAWRNCTSAAPHRLEPGRVVAESIAAAAAAAIAALMSAYDMDSGRPHISRRTRVRFFSAGDSLRDLIAACSRSHRYLIGDAVTFTCRIYSCDIRSALYSSAPRLYALHDENRWIVCRTVCFC